MKKLLTVIMVTVILGIAATVPCSAFDPVEGINLTPEFVLEKAEASPVLDGAINQGEYFLISEYKPLNEDWFISDYDCVRQYAANDNPDYKIEVYGCWTEEGIYTAVKTDCADSAHTVNLDPVWNGCGVMIGFVPESPDSPDYKDYQGYDAMGDALNEVAYSCNPDGSINLNNTTNDGELDSNVFITYKHADGYDIYEMKFLWSFVGCDPSLDHVLGLGLMISKNNKQAADGIDWVCFQSDIVNAKLPQTYSKLVLKDDAKPVAESIAEPTAEPVIKNDSESAAAESSINPVTADIPFVCFVFASFAAVVVFYKTKKGNRIFVKNNL